MKINKKHLLYIALTFALCFAIYTYWETGANYLSIIYKASLPFITGAAIAFVVNILMSAYERLISRFIKLSFILKIKRGIAMLLSYLTFVVLLVWIVSIVLPDLIESINTLLKDNRSAVSNLINVLNDNETIQKWIQQLGGSKQISNTINSYSSQILSQVMSALTSVLTSLTSLPSTIINLFISLVFSAYVLAGKEKLAYQANQLIDTYMGKFGKTFRYVVEILNHRFHSFFVFQTVEACILGSLCFIGMVIFKLPYAGTISILVSFTAMIPVVGAYIGLVIGAILIMTQSVNQAIFFVIYLIVLQQFEGNLIYPRVVGGSIGLPGMWVLLAIAVGSALGGILGMILAVPTAATIYQIIKDNVAKRQAAKEVSQGD
ncbi:AI-2E family transporter [Streptococcus dentiloxodontae]